MFADPLRPDALAPSFTATSDARFDYARGRRAHPAGRRRAESGVPLEALREMAARLAPPMARADHAWPDLQWIEGNRRRYIRLLDGDLYDAWLIAWSPSSSLELHDHGGSQGAIALAAGTLVETYTDLSGRHPIRTRALHVSDILTVPPSRLHEVSNPGPTDALSVHVYSPPLKSMTFYDRDPDSFLSPLSITEGDLAALEEAAM